MAKSGGVTIIEAVKALKKMGFESIGRQTLRQYEQAGLLTPIRKKNKYRIYSYDKIDRLELILTMRGLNFSITEIKEIFDYWDTTNTICMDVFKHVRDGGELDDELKRKAQVVKNAYQEQIGFMRKRIIARLQQTVALLELRIDKEKQKIQRLEKSCETIDEITDYIKNQDIH